MTPIYNLYLKPSRDEKYVSEIAFINSKEPIVSHSLYYVEFNESTNRKSSFYSDSSDNYLNRLYFKLRNNYSFNGMNLENSNNLISNVAPSIKYYSYVEVINDSRNPKLEGQTMIFSFGRKVAQIISECHLNNNTFNNTFRIIIEHKNGFPNYDNCHFTNTKLNRSDQTLDINTEINFKQINIKQIEREEKLKKLTSDIELKNERYEEYLKLKKEFENE